MAQGKYKLYYSDAAGKQVSCKDVYYRIIDMMPFKAGSVLCQGITDANGDTVFIRSASNSNPLAPAQSPYLGPALPFPIAPQEKVSTDFRLEVLDAATRKYVAPELHSKEKDSVSISLGQHNAGVNVVRSLQLRPFQRARLISKVSQTPIPKAKYVGYMVDGNGKTVRARDEQSDQITGVTDNKGLTPRIYTAHNIKFEFSLPQAATIKISGAYCAPSVTGMAAVVETVEVKGMAGMTNSQANNAAQVMGKTSAPIIVNAEAGELIIIPKKAWEEFEQMSGYLEGVISAAHKAKLNLSNALENKDVATIKRAEENLGLAEDKVKAMLGKDFKKLADLQEVITYETYNNGKEKGSQLGVRRRYIPKKKYEELRKKTFKGVPYKVDFKAKPGVTVKGPSAGPVTSAGKIKSKDMDYDKLTESFRKIDLSIKTELAKGEASATYDLSPIDAGFFTIVGGETAKTIQLGDAFEADASAQWMRFIGSAGYNADLNIDPRKGIVKAQLQGNLQAKAIAFEGKAVARYAIPSLNGWMLRNEAIDLGAIRFVIEGEVYGFAGAKGTLSGTLGVSIDVKNKTFTDSPKLSNNLADKGKQPRFVAGMNEKAPENLNGLKCEAEIFVGVEGGLKCKGSFQWLPPQAKDFSAIGELGGDAAASAGAGASAMMHVYYQNGKFRIKASARLCWGIGAKGAVDFMVDAGKVLEMVKWVYHQLMNAGFKVLLYIADDAFKIISQIVFTVIAENSPIGQLLKQNFRAINESFGALLKDFELAETRSKMVNNINRVAKKPEKENCLMWSTPETRGMLMYQIIRHSKFSHARDWPTTTLEGFDPQVHYLPTHKDAILNIMRTVRTAPEWDNVMQHVHPRGEKSSQASGKNEGDVLRLLNHGVSLNDDLPSVFDALNKNLAVAEQLGNAYLDKYIKLRKAVLNQFPKGYIIVQNGTPAFEQMAALEGHTHPEFGAHAMVAEWHDEPGYPGEPGSGDDKTAYA